MKRSNDWWRGCVVYQIYPRSFFDSNGDGIGDLPGVLQKLDYVASLGVDAVWISPFFASPMHDFGYDVSDYRAVAPELGTLEDVDRIIERAHGLGLKVLIDQVLSHTSDQHAWFLESRRNRTNPKADWYVWADPKPDGTPPNNWLSVFGGPAWQWEPRRRQYYLHNFLTSQPDLNFHTPAMVTQLLEEMEFWLRRGGDGFRLDAINVCVHDLELRDNPPLPDGPAGDDSVYGNTPYKYQFHLYDKTRPEALSIMQQVRSLLNRYPGSVALGELSTDDGRDLVTMAAYTAGNDKLHMAYTFDLLGLRSSPDYLRQVISETAAAMHDGWPCMAMSNHDVTRVATRWGAPLLAGSTPEPGSESELEDRLSVLLLAFLCSVRGSASIYQGEELGLPDVDVPYHAVRDPFGLAMWPDFKGRDGCRTVMPWHASEPYAGFSTAEPWLPVDPPQAHRRRAVAEQDSRPGSVLERVRGFLTWRRQHPALRQGSMELVDAPDQVIAFVRATGSQDNHNQDQVAAERLLVAFNLGATQAELAVPAGGSVSALSGHGFEGAKVTGGQLTLPAFGAFFGRLTLPGA